MMTDSVLVVLIDDILNSLEHQNVAHRANRIDSGNRRNWIDFVFRAVRLLDSLGINILN